MQTDRLNLVVLKFLCGLAACLSSASLYAQRPAPAGVVRISDRPRSSRQPARRVQPAAVVRGQQVLPTPEPMAQESSYVEYSEPAHAMTGNPLRDLYRTVTMRRSTAGTGYATQQYGTGQMTGLLAPNGGLFSRIKGHGGGCSCGDGCSCGGGCACGSGGSCEHGDCGCRGNEDDDDDGCCCGRCLSKICKCDHAFKRRVFGYFMCDGCGGQGCPKCGHYNLLYSQNPRYFDRRDGSVYAAQGWGVPMAVPLAPNVRHTYNYGWGIPSSRLTPISTRAPF